MSTEVLEAVDVTQSNVLKEDAFVDMMSLIEAGEYRSLGSPNPEFDTMSDRDLTPSHASALEWECGVELHDVVEQSLLESVY